MADAVKEGPGAAIIARVQPVQRQHGEAVDPPQWPPHIVGNRVHERLDFRGPPRDAVFQLGIDGQKLIRMEIKGRQIVSQETLIADYGRVRDVKVGPDGLLYVLLQNMNGDAKGGSIIRLVPAN